MYCMVACFCLIFTVAMVTLPGILKGPNGVLPLPNPSSGPGTVVGDDDNQPGIEPLQPPDKKEIVINWDGIAVNESMGLAPDSSRLYPDSALYEEEIWGQKEIEEYYGRELNVPYIPDGLTGGGKAVTATIYREKVTGKIIEDQAGRGFWADFWEDGSPKSDDDIMIPKGFDITVSKLGILHCTVAFSQWTRNALLTSAECLSLSITVLFPTETAFPKRLLDIMISIQPPSP